MIYHFPLSCSLLLLQLGVLPVPWLPWLPVHHGERPSRRRVQTLQRVGLPCSVVPGAITASSPAMRPAASSPNLSLFTSSSSSSSSSLHLIIPAIPGGSSSRCSQRGCVFLLPSENKKRWLNELRREESSHWRKADDWRPTDDDRVVMSLRLIAPHFL